METVDCADNHSYPNQEKIALDFSLVLVINAHPIMQWAITKKALNQSNPGNNHN